MRLLTLVPALLLSIACLPSATPRADSASTLETRESATNLLLDGLSSILLDDNSSHLTKRQNTTSSSSSPPPIGDALDDLLNGGFFGELLDLLRDSENIFTPEWNDRFGELVDSVAPLAYYVGQFLGWFLNSILNGGFGGGGELPPLPTSAPSPTGTSQPGFEWPDFDLDWPTGSGDGPTPTGTESPAPTSDSDSDSPGFDFDFDFPGSSGGETDDLGSPTETGTGDDEGIDIDIPTGTTPDDALFTGAAATPRVGGLAAASAGLAVFLGFAVLG
ncbi:hypothetical protein ASPCAL07403 [Aspergillus calidoustus]|uniref:Uncharacterized protein n=1 Tax=Aspergillus calidoustus TaxID=454130 RepID=A0A0U5CAU9_ASPCI|nr:hypothetical protein ASPCAL07403 [Aspergillus calidoustus]